MISHSLLAGQLKKANIRTFKDINEENFKQLLNLVEQSYHHYEEDKNLHEKNAKLASSEFQELTKDLKNKVKEVEKTNDNIKNSIEYASLMQQAILPSSNNLKQFSADYFICWMPKDIVGGDIYLINTLDTDSVLIMVIDGAGHGVSGAFLTMLVKAIEEQIVAKIKDKSLRPSPALILEYFNLSIKIMLQQNKESKSNSGFDGGILYYNKKHNICKYAGAKTPLYIVNNGKLKIIKSDRKSVGYRRTDISQKYTEHEIIIKKETKLYITTDGMPDQEGNDNSRFGIERFKKFIVENQNISLSEQYQELQKLFKDFKGHTQQSDDITVVGLNFK
ncbi:MAG: Response regulator containing a CheY-like receiver domain and an HD-GYP domain [uncultured Sulfurovum sp.]|uniref:Response regulator containing a CheY-like receiver domain and an HD-GYP domain n=1 Tax=uncultured Sulfurovum sp. TaxID=269237 RepID=A0A6S6U881_9BACT|nr:MAG: Response regulator containing a CheY-like receiver domain and an HD-GYP domain [uncultured Sulfurovum sp.]